MQWYVAIFREFGYFWHQLSGNTGQLLRFGFPNQRHFYVNKKDTVQEKIA